MDTRDKRASETHNFPRQSEIDKYNATPQVSLGGRTPYGLVYDRGALSQLLESEDKAGTGRETRVHGFVNDFFCLKNGPNI